MSPKAEAPKTPVVTCNWCEEPTSVPGHAVDPQSGRVLACPKVDMIVQGDHLGGMR